MAESTAEWEWVISRVSSRNAHISVLELANSNHLRKALLQAWASLVPGGLDAMTIDSGYAFSVPCRSLAIHSFPP